MINKFTPLHPVHTPSDNVGGPRPDSRNLAQLVAAIAALREIPPGSALVPLIGGGTESNNRDALATWLRANYAAVSELPPRAQVAALVARLDSDIHDLLISCDPC